MGLSVNGSEGAPLNADGFEVQNQGVTKRNPGEGPKANGGGHDARDYGDASWIGEAVEWRDAGPDNSWAEINGTYVQIVRPELYGTVTWKLKRPDGSVESGNARTITQAKQQLEAMLDVPPLREFWGGMKDAEGYDVAPDRAGPEEREKMDESIAPSMSRVFMLREDVTGMEWRRAEGGTYDVATIPWGRFTVHRLNSNRYDGDFWWQWDPNGKFANFPGMSHVQGSAMSMEEAKQACWRHYVQMNKGAPRWATKKQIGEAMEDFRGSYFMIQTAGESSEDGIAVARLDADPTQQAGTGASSSPDWQTLPDVRAALEAIGDRELIEPGKQFWDQMETGSQAMRIDPADKEEPFQSVPKMPLDTGREDT